LNGKKKLDSKQVGSEEVGRKKYVKKRLGSEASAFVTGLDNEKGKECERRIAVTTFFSTWG